MKLRKTSGAEAGFSLFEILIALTLIAMMAGYAFELAPAMKDANVLESVSTTIALLEKARADAVALKAPGAGIHFGRSTVEYFSGPVYTPGGRELFFDWGDSVWYEPEGDVVFAALSGRTTAAQISVKSASWKTLITLNEEGAIEIK